MSNKKLTQLTEKLTSLNPDDLLYVSTNGVSKSIKASTLEAPLKSYADTKASEAQAAAISAANSTAQSLVNSESVRATSAESNLQNQITEEISDRIEADQALQASLTVEASRAVNAESQLQNQILQEVSDRQALASRVSELESDPVTKSYVDGEVSDLQLQVSALLSNVDPAALDSFTEVVAAFQSADSSLSGAITTLASDLTANLNSEISARQSGDSSLQSQITQEVSDRQAAVSAEQALREAGDSSLQSQLTQEISDREAAVSAEESRAMSAESSLQSQIAQEVSDREAAVLSEKTLREAADSDLQAQISQEILDRQAAISQEVLDRNAAIYNATTGHIIPRETLVYDLGSEDYRFRDLYLSGNTIILGETVISSNENGELNLQEGATVGGLLIASTNYVDSAIDSEESARIAADQALQTSINNEQSRAMAAESALGVRIDNVLSNIDPVALDSLTELVTAFQAADSNLSGAITSLATSTANSISAESAARQTAIANEQSARASADSMVLSSAQSYTNSVAATLIPVGMISMFAGTVAPSGYLMCDGSAVSRTTYSALFNVIGTSYGSGNGSTTFNLPNPDSNSNIRLIIKA